MTEEQFQQAMAIRSELGSIKEPMDVVGEMLRRGLLPQSIVLSGTERRIDLDDFDAEARGLIADFLGAFLTRYELRVRQRLANV